MTFNDDSDAVSSSTGAGAVFLNAGWFSRDHFSLTAGSAIFLGATAAGGLSSAIAASVRDMASSSSALSPTNSALSGSACNPNSTLSNYIES